VNRRRRYIGLAFVASALCIALVLGAAAASALGPGDEYKGVDLPDEVQPAASVLPAVVTVDETRRLHPAHREILGLSHHWMWGDRLAMDREGHRISEEFLHQLAGLPMPFNRMAGTDSQGFRWKMAIGPMEERQEQKVQGNDRTGKKRFGPVEWIQSTLAIDPRAKFVYVFNMRRDTVQDRADLVEFLTGDGQTNPNGGINWAAKRVECGMRDPVPDIIWSLGNELDWGRRRANYPPEEYVELCRETIAAVRAVDPDARFVAHVASAPWNPAYGQAGKDWRDLHRAILRELGDDIDFLDFHCYYYGMASSKMEDYMDAIRDDTRAITGSDRIKLLITEHGMWMGSIPTHSLKGCLATAQFINRCLAREEVVGANYHNVSAGPWGVIYRGRETGKLYTTGILDMIRVLNEGVGDQVVFSSVKGERCDPRRNDISFTVTAMTTPEGLNLILVNREADVARDLTFQFQRGYRLVEKISLSAESLDSHNTEFQREIIVSREQPQMPEELRRFLMPAKTLATLKLKLIPATG